MEMESCEHHHCVHTQYSSIVCIDCGVEKPILTYTPDYQSMVNSAPLVRYYSRKDRWIALIKKVLGIHSGPPVADPVWEYLSARKPFEGVDGIRVCLRKSKLRNKHYPSLHCFAKLFSQAYRRPTTSANFVYKQLTKYFDIILRLWNKYKTHPNVNTKLFFSYNWLIEQGLAFYNLKEYMPFVKRLKCNSRRKKYVNMLLKLYETHAQNWNRGQQDTHLPSESGHSPIPRNQLQLHRRPVERTVANHPVVRGEGWERDLIRRWLKSRGAPATS